MKKPVIVLFSILSIIIALSIVQVVVANNISTTGAELAKLQDEVNRYKRENAVVHEQILKASSFITIAETAEKQGYVAIKTEVYLSTPLPLALKQ